MDRRAAIRTDSRGLPVRVQRGGDDGSNVAPGSGDQQPQCPRQGHQLHGEARHDALGSSLSGLKYFRKATFGGNADAVALDVKGTIGRLTFKRGLGDPTAVSNAKESVANANPNLTPNTVYLPATNYGVPLGSEGYPAHGLLGGVVTAKSIRSLKVGPANYTVLTAQNPKFIITGSTRTATPYMVNPGTALTNAAITTQGSIGKVASLAISSTLRSRPDSTTSRTLPDCKRPAKPAGSHALPSAETWSTACDSATFRPAKNTTTGQYVYSTTTGTAGNGSITGTSTAPLVGHGIRRGLLFQIDPPRGRPTTPAAERLWVILSVLVSSPDGSEANCPRASNG